MKIDSQQFEFYEDFVDVLWDLKGLPYLEPVIVNKLKEYEAAGITSYDYTL